MRVMAPTPADPAPMVTDASENELVAGLRRSDPAAYERFVRELSPRLLAVARRMMHSEEDAADALQDAFVSAFSAIKTFDGRSRLSTWMHRIVVNACLMRLRKIKRRGERQIEEFLPRFIDDGHQATPSEAWKHGAAGDAHRADVRELIHKKINELPDAYRTVLVLRDIEQVDTEEAAEMLGESVNAVKTRLHRARQALRTLLEPYMSGGSL